MVTAGMSACPLVGKVDALGWVLCSWVGSCARRLDSEVAVRARTADLGAGECVKVADTLVNLRNGKLGGPMKATGRYERVACVLGTHNLLRVKPHKLTIKAVSSAYWGAKRAPQLDNVLNNTPNLFGVGRK